MIGRLPRIPIDDKAGICAGLREQGLAILPGMLGASRAAEICGWLDALDLAPGDTAEDDTKYFHNLFNRGPQWLPLIDPPGVIEAVEELLGDRCHIIGMSAWQTPPGTGKEPRRADGSHDLHADQIFFPVDEELLVTGRVELPVLLMTLHYYLVDVDADLSPTWVVPGSHLAGVGPGGSRPPPGHPGTLHGFETDWRGQAPVPVLCSAGDGMLFRSEAWHSGSHNRTADRSRYLLQVHYGTRAVATRFATHLDFRHNPAVLAAANPRQQRLLGDHQPTAYG